MTVSLDVSAGLIRYIWQRRLLRLLEGLLRWIVATGVRCSVLELDSPDVRRECPLLCPSMNVPEELSEILA